MGKLIAHCEKSPIIIPMYHRGMDGVLPEKILKDRKTKRPSTPISPIPRMGNDIRLFVGEAIDFTEKVWMLFCIEGFFYYLINVYNITECLILTLSDYR